MSDAPQKPLHLKPWHCPRCGKDCSGLTNDTKDTGDAVGYFITCTCGCEFIHYENITYEPYGVEVDGETYEYPVKPLDAGRLILVTTKRDLGHRTGVIVQGFRDALRVTAYLLGEKSAWCEVMPLPDDEYEVICKTEHEAVVLAQFGPPIGRPEKGDDES